MVMANLRINLPEHVLAQFTIGFGVILPDCEFLSIRLFMLGSPCRQWRISTVHSGCPKNTGRHLAGLMSPIPAASM